MVELAQLVSAPDCGSGDQGFESLIPPWYSKPAYATQGYRQGVRHSTLTAVFAGSNPASPASCSYHSEIYEILAQLVEHLTFNQVVGGSTPPCLTPRKTA